MARRNLSPEARQRQRDAQREWHAENLDKIIFAAPKGSRERYKSLAELRGQSLSGMIRGMLDAECDRRGL